MLCGPMIREGGNHVWWEEGVSMSVNMDSKDEKMKGFVVSANNNCNFLILLCLLILFNLLLLFNNRIFSTMYEKIKQHLAF